MGSGTFTRTEATADATKLVMDILTGLSQSRKFRRNWTSRATISPVFTVASKPLNQVTDRVLTVAAFGLPEDYNQTYPTKIRASLKEVQPQTRKYFTTGDLDLIPWQGNVSRFRDKLKTAFERAIHRNSV